MILANLLFTYLGIKSQGIRLTQIPCFLAQVANLISYLGFRRLDLFAFSMILNSIIIYFFYGECSLASLGTPKGPYAVGFKRFWSRSGQNVLCFYPIKYENWATLRQSDKPLWLSFGERSLDQLVSQS